MSSIYTPLDKQKDEVRLINFLTREDSEIIYISLNAHPLHEAGLSFQALSYTWLTEQELLAKSAAEESGNGMNQSEQRPICIDGKTHQISVNLYTALKQIRRTLSGDENFTAKLYWADAICINQEDEAEKGRQVAMMGRIYLAAAHVIIWLGEDDKSSRVVFDLLRKWTDFALSNPGLRSTCVAYLEDDPDTTEGQDFTQAPHPTESPNGSAVPLSLWTDLKTAGLDDYINVAALSALDEFFKRSYWTRVWIIQERVLARRATLCCGTLTADARHLDLLVILLRALITIGAELSSEERTICNRLVQGSVDNVLEIRAGKVDGVLPFDQKSKLLRRLLPDGLSMSFPVEKDLWALIRLMANYECTDLRDKVFGLYGLLEDQQKPMKPNYTTASVAQVYKNLFIKHVNATKSLEMLAFGGSYLKPHLSPNATPMKIARAARAATSLRDVPSWVPDFAGLTCNLCAISPGDFQADNKGSMESEMTSGDSSELVVEGILCGTVSGACQSGALDSYQEILRAWTKFMLEAPFHPLWPPHKALVDVLCYNVLVASENVLRTLERSNLGLMLSALAKNVLALASDPDFPDGTDFMLSTVQKERSSRGGMSARLAQISHSFAINAYRGLLKVSEGVGDELRKRMKSLSESLEQLCWTIKNHGRALFIMKGEQTGFMPQRDHDFVGFGPESVLPGDQIWVICGCGLPIVLRSIGGKDGRYRVIGYATVYGMMEGEMVMPDTKGNTPKFCTIQLNGTRDLD